MTNIDFEKTVEAAIASLPPVFKDQLDNVEVVVEDMPHDSGVLKRLARSHMLLLGLYRGVPKTKRFGIFLLPDKITIYRQPILAVSHDDDEAKRRIRDTVLHEIGHHFGLSDNELQRIGK